MTCRDCGRDFPTLTRELQRLDVHGVVTCRDCGRDFPTLSRELQRLDVFRALGDETALCVDCIPAYLDMVDVLSVEELIKRLRGQA